MPEQNYGPHILYFFSQLIFISASVSASSCCPSLSPPQVAALPYLKSKFNFSQTVGEMGFVSFEVEKMRIF